MRLNLHRRIALKLIQGTGLCWPAIQNPNTAAAENGESRPSAPSLTEKGLPRSEEREREREILCDWAPPDLQMKTRTASIRETFGWDDLPVLTTIDSTQPLELASNESRVPSVSCLGSEGRSNHPKSCPVKDLLASASIGHFPIRANTNYRPLHPMSRVKRANYKYE